MDRGGWLTSHNNSHPPGVPGKPPTPDIPGNGGPGPRLEGVPGCDLSVPPRENSKKRGPFFVFFVGWLVGSCKMFFFTNLM